MDFNIADGILLLCLLFANINHIRGGCGVECNWMAWKSWSSCSATCGGGTRSRLRPACCKHNQPFDECMSSCGLSSRDSDASESCNRRCFHGGSYTGSGWYSSCNCKDPYYGTCCETCEFALYILFIFFLFIILI